MKFYWTRNFASWHCCRKSKLLSSDFFQKIVIAVTFTKLPWLRESNGTLRFSGQVEVKTKSAQK